MPDYSLVAIRGDTRSNPKVVHVSTPPAGEPYSGHAYVRPPQGSTAG